jgi:hypothetical protein
MSRFDLFRRIKLRGASAVPASVPDLANPFPPIGPSLSADPSLTNIARPSNRACTCKPNSEHPSSQFPHTLEPAA